MAEEPEIIPPSQYVERMVRALAKEDPHAYVNQIVNALRELYESKFAARDEAVRLLHEDMVRVPTMLDRTEEKIMALLGTRLTLLEGFVNEKFNAEHTLTKEKLVAVDERFEAAVKIRNGQFEAERVYVNERFNAVILRFTEMEKRSKDLDEARALALAAALQAAKEAVAEQNRSNTTAIGKSETAVGEQIKQMRETFDTALRGQGIQITDLKSRIDRGEGGNSGATNLRTEQRANTTVNVGIIGCAIAFAAVVISGAVLFHNPAPPQPVVQYVPAPTAVPATPAPVTVPR
jgi:hypothetical protein